MAKGKKKKNKKITEQKSISGGKKVLFVLTLVLIIPLTLFGMELILGWSGQGISTAPFHKVSSDPDFFRDNLDYVFKYHSISRKSTTTIYKNFFTVPKSGDTLRGVVLGGSTAEGFPFASNQSFSGILARAMGYSLGRPVEILNLGFSAMSSYYVRDAASKIKDLDLDFVIIYSGHNEYYGTISYSTGSGHFSNLLNMKLKESRLFQVLFNAFVPPAMVGTGKNNTLMARQFANAHFPPSPEQEQEVGDRLSDNLLKAAQTFSAQGLPVFVLEPISNLVDMAPFVSKEQAGLSEEFLDLGERLLRGETSAANELVYRQAELQGQGAVQEYLLARANLLLGKEDYGRFVLAKDQDPIPFRARQTVVSNLRQSLAGIENIHWIPTSDKVLQRYGLRGFSNTLFIDHLHLNHRGQTFLADIISQEMLKAGFLKEERRSGLREFFSNPELIQNSIFFLGIYDYAALDKIQKLINAPPYTQMTFPYQNKERASGLQAEQLIGFSAISDLASIENEDLITRYAEYLLSLNDNQAYLTFLQAFNQINPGSEDTHFMSGNFFAQFDGREQVAVKEYSLAIMLSPDPELMRQRVRNFLNQIKKPHLAP